MAGTGVQGSASNQLYYPFGIAIDSSNSLYVADWQNNRVQKWPVNASVGTTVAGQANGTSGSSSSYLTTASDVILDSSGNVYVADMGNSRIQFWSNGSTSGTTIAGTTGKRTGILPKPFIGCIDLYVTSSSCTGSSWVINEPHM